MTEDWKSTKRIDRRRQPALLSGNTGLPVLDTFALVVPGFTTARVTDGKGRSADLTLALLRDLLSRHDDPVLPAAELEKIPALDEALTHIWGAVPHAVLVTPVLGLPSRCLALVGLEEIPDEAVAIALEAAAEQRSTELLALDPADKAEVERWSENHVPTLVFGNDGRLLHLGAEAGRFFRRSRSTDLEELLGKEALAGIMAASKNLRVGRIHEAHTTIRPPGRGVWATQLRLIRRAGVTILLLAELEQVSEPPESISGELTTLIESGVHQRPGAVKLWLTCDPLPPIPLGAKSEITIGRHEKNDLVLPHSAVSRFHAVIKIEDGEPTIYDLGSSNGVVINHVRRAGQVLNVNDEIEIGPYQLMLREPGEGNDAMIESTTRTKLGLMPLDAAMAGKLDETPFAELMQSLEFNGKTGTLLVSSDRTRGHFSAINGQAHSAGFGSRSGVEAVAAMMRLNSGRFSFTTAAPESERELRGPITSLMLEASRLLDEESAAG